MAPYCSYQDSKQESVCSWVTSFLHSFRIAIISPDLQHPIFEWEFISRNKCQLQLTSYVEICKKGEGIIQQLRKLIRTEQKFKENISREIAQQMYIDLEGFMGFMKAI